MTNGAEYLVQQLKEAVELLGLDGVDLVQRQGYGTANMNANDETSIQVFGTKFDCSLDIIIDIEFFT